MDELQKPCVFYTIRSHVEIPAMVQAASRKRYHAKSGSKKPHAAEDLYTVASYQALWHVVLFLQQLCS